MKNSQVAVICAAILAAALINRCSNFCPGAVAQERATWRSLPRASATSSVASDRRPACRRRSRWP